MSGPRKHNLDPSLQVQLVPEGGQAGQILAKIDGTDHALQWIFPNVLGEDCFYIHDQIASSASWTITHNLGKYPSVSVVDSGGTLVVGEVHYLSNNSLTVTFSAEFAGKAYLN